jgi:hypothetical protein
MRPEAYVFEMFSESCHGCCVEVRGPWSRDGDSRTEVDSPPINGPTSGPTPHALNVALGRQEPTGNKT